MNLRALEADHVVLAVVERHTLLVVVVKEAVETTTEDEDVLRVDSSDTPGASALGRVAGARGSEIGVVEVGVDRKGYSGVGVALHVGSLGLDQRHVDVAGALELVVVENVVLRGGTPEPGALGALNQDTSAVVDVDLRVVGKVKLVIGDPQPGVLHVDAGLLGDVHEHERTDTLGVGLGLDLGSLLAGVGLELGTSRASDAEVNVKETSRAGSLTSDVELHEDGTGLRAESLEHEILDLDVADITLLTNLPDRLGVGLVLEVLVAAGHDERPDLTDNLDVLGDLDSVGDDVGAVVKVDNLAFSDAVKDSLDSSGIIRDTITLGALGLDRHKLGSGDVVVLGLALGDDLASAVEEDRGLLDGGLGILDSLTVAADVSTALNPRVDLGVAGEDGSLSALVLDGDGDGRRHVDVVEDQGTVGARLGGVVGGENTDLSVGDLAVEQENRTDVLDVLAGSHVNTDVATVNVESVEGPDPVPVHVDSSVAVAESHVASSKLLTTEETTVLATNEHKISHEAAGAVVDKDALLDVVLALVLNHLEDNVLERSSLGDLPVDTGTRSLGHAGEVDLEVSDLAEKVVLVGVPVVALVVVGVAVDDGHAGKVGGGLENGKGLDIADHVGVVVGEDGLGDDVGAGREVNKSRADGARVAAETAAVAIREGGVDGLGIVSSAITLGTVVLDVSEDLVIGRATVGDGTLTLNGCEPPGVGGRDTVLGGSDRNSSRRSRHLRSSRDG